MSLSEPQNMLEFVLLVANMRDAQKRFLRDRSQAAMLAMKILERRVDLALMRQKASDLEKQEEVPW